jgi:uncharacterized delta-60 repeat protein
MVRRGFFVSEATRAARSVGLFTSGFRALMGAALALIAVATHAQDGHYDATWAAGGRQMVDVGPLADSGMALAVQRDGKLVIGGHCGEIQAGDAFCAVRLRRDGQTDLTFGPNETGRILLSEEPGFPPYNTLGTHGLALQADGRILMAGTGTFHLGGGVTGHSGVLVRLTADGRLESTSGGGTYTSVHFSSHENVNFRQNRVNAVVAATGGKILVAGETHRAGSNPPNADFGIARFNADRSPDYSFNGSGVRLGAFDLGGDHGDSARALAVQRGNRIVVAGLARGADGQLNAAVLRLNADGSSDQDFGNGGRVWLDNPGNIYVNAVAIDRYDRILLAGGRQIGGSTDHDFFVARLTADGQPDASFGLGGVASVPFDLASPWFDEAWDVVLQGDRILVTGLVSRNPAPGNSFAVARLLPNGSLDLSFGNAGKSVGTFAPPSQGTPGNDFAYAGVIGNGGLMVAGNGVAQGGQNQFGVAKLQLDGIFDDGFE